MRGFGRAQEDGDGHGANTGRRRPQATREFQTFTGRLVELRDWLKSEGVTQVAREATGVYWKPVVRHEALMNRGEMKGLSLWAVAAAC